MTESRREGWDRTRWRIAGLVGLVLVTEAFGLLFGIPAALMNLLRMGEVWVAGAAGVAGPAAVRRWWIALGALAVLEVALAVAGAYVGLVWVLRIFLYPQALLFTTPPGGEIRYGYVWGSTLAVMLLAFLIEKSTKSWSPAGMWAVRGAAAAAVAIALVFFDRVFRGLVSLKFGAVCLTLMTMLSILGTLVVQRPPVAPEEYPEKFAMGQVGFLVNAEILLGRTEVRTPDLGAHPANLSRAFGAQAGKKWSARAERSIKNDEVARITKERIAAHRDEVTRLMGFLDGIYFTTMFKSYAFNSLLVLLALSLVAVIAKKFPWGGYGWGPVVTHAGIVMLLAGAAVSDLTVREGMVRLTPKGPGSTTDRFLDRSRSVEGAIGEGGLDAALERIDREIPGPVYVQFEGPERATLDRRSAGEVWTLERDGRPIATGDAAREAVRGFRHGHYVAAPWVELPFSVRMTEGFVDYYRELLISAPKLSSHRRPVEEGYPLLPGKRIPLFDGMHVARILEVVPHARVRTGGERILVLTLPAGEETTRHVLPATPGTRRTFRTPTGEYELEVLAVAGNYALAEQNVPLERQDESNPAARVRVRAPSGAEETIWLFANFPQFYRQGAMGKKNPEVPVEDLVYGMAAGSGGGPGALRDEQVTRVEVEPGEIPAPGLEPLVRVALDSLGPDGRPVTETRWLRLSGSPEQTALASPDGEIVIRMVQTGQPSVFETHLDILGAGGEVAGEHTVRVNQPLVRDGFRFYQTNFDSSHGRPVSWLTVKYDAGIPILYAGFVVTMAGLILAFYVLRPLRRKAEAAKREQAGSEIRKGMGF